MADDKTKARIIELREGMKTNTILDEVQVSDQAAGVPQPPLDKPYSGIRSVPLTMDFDHVVQDSSFLRLLNSRVSRRRYSDWPLKLDELAFLLWATQGVRSVTGSQNRATRRTVPSAGSRHPLETYLLIQRVEGLLPGLYHYLSLEHKIEFLKPVEDAADRISEACCGQTFIGAAPVVFIWTAVPYRSEWRYGTSAHKYMLVDAGHVCQNLYLASEAIGCGTCAIGAYDQALMDGLIGLDSQPSCDDADEYVIYAAPVGHCD